MKPIVPLGLFCALMTSSVLAQGAGNLDRRFEQFDRNQDGKVTRQEARNAGWFDRLDRNRDGSITLDEVRGRTLRSIADPTANVSARRDVGYGQHNAQKLDIYAPEEADSAPVMVYVHGGGWQRGDKAAVGRKVEFFTGMGWVLVSINYRLLPEGRHPANVQDVALALAWVHDHVASYGGNPDKIFLMGHSAGAHLVALLATDQRHLKAMGKGLTIVKGVIPLDTQAYDLVTLTKTSSSSLYNHVFGDDPQMQRDASPREHVREGKGIPPFLICYSRGVARANPYRARAAEAFAAALKSAGVSVEVVDASDRSHAEINTWFGDPEDDKVTGKAKDFLSSLSRGEDAPATSP